MLSSKGVGVVVGGGTKKEVSNDWLVWNVPGRSRGKTVTVSNCQQTGHQSTVRNCRSLFGDPEEREADLAGVV